MAALKIDAPTTSPLTSKGSVAPSGAQDRASQGPAATDFHQFAALRRGADAHDPKALREAARQFESIFTKMMLDSMRKASFGDSLMGSDQVEMYQGMMDDQLAVQLSRGKGMGLADMLVRQLQGGAGQGASAPAAQTDGSAGTNNVSPEQQKKFVEQFLPHATAAAQQLGVDARAIVAQAALETGWGTHQPGGANGASNNNFGIKAGASWAGARVDSATTEYVAGKAGSEDAPFRAYGNVAEGVADYVHVLRDNPRYAAALGTGSDVRAFATALQQGGYATDPQYANKLVAIAERLPLAANVKEFKSSATAPIETQEPRLNNG
jgi:flagellar protein FlgJ